MWINLCVVVAKHKRTNGVIQIHHRVSGVEIFFSKGIGFSNYEEAVVNVQPCGITNARSFICRDLERFSQEIKAEPSLVNRNIFKLS